MDSGALVNASEAEMTAKLQAAVSEPNFFDTHVMLANGHIVPKGTEGEWDSK